MKNPISSLWRTVMVNLKRRRRHRKNFRESARQKKIETAAKALAERQAKARALALAEEERKTHKEIWTVLCKRVQRSFDPFFAESEWVALSSDSRISKLKIEAGADNVIITVTTTEIIVPVKHGWGAHLGVYGVHFVFENLLDQGENVPPINAKARLKVYPVRSEKKDGKVSYENGGGDMGFCFGSGERKAELLRLLKEFEVYGAINLVLDSFWHLNEPVNEAQNYPYVKVPGGSNVT